MSAARDVRARPVVVVVCAEAEAAALTPIIRGLVARRLRVDLVPVPEGNMQPLEGALEQFGVGATYVVCNTAALERYTADLCSLTIRAAEVPESRLVAAWCDLSDPDAFVEMVAGRATASAAPSTPPEPEADPTVHASARPVPQVVVHTPAPQQARGEPSPEESAASTRVAMKMALGWRRILRPTTYVIVALIIVGIGLYFGGYDAIAGAALRG